MARTNKCFWSQEKYAEALNAAHKHVAGCFTREQLEVIQSALDDRCEDLYDNYLSSYKELEDCFVSRAFSPTGTLSRCLPCGSAPHERAFLEGTSALSRNLRAELRQLLSIYETLGLRTNYPLCRVLGYKSQGRRCVLQGVSNLL